MSELAKQTIDAMGEQNFMMASRKYLVAMVQLRRALSRRGYVEPHEVAKHPIAQAWLCHLAFLSGVRTELPNSVLDDVFKLIESEDV